MKPTNAERYASLQIWSDAPPPRLRASSAAGAPGRRRRFQARMERMRQVNILSTPILAQVGAALPRRRRALRRTRASGAPRPDRPLPDRRCGDRLHPQRPRRPAPRRRLARLWRLLPERGAVGALRACRRPDRPGAERRRHRRPQPARTGGAPLPPRTTATTPATATGSTSWPGSATWAPATRPTAATPCGRTTPWAPPGACRRARP